MLELIAGNVEGTEEHLDTKNLNDISKLLPKRIIFFLQMLEDYSTRLELAFVLPVCFSFLLFRVSKRTQ